MLFVKLADDSMSKFSTFILLYRKNIATWPANKFLSV